ncbi:MAG: iron-containing alcohol dehydrogenase [Streptosporangiaceae bacterium]|nr:iron-containing alcohol dehydrogenase [Streptosporangiaceae bacterium]
MNTGGWPSETVITWQAPPVRFGLGATREVGYEARQLGLRSVLLVTDPQLWQAGLPQRVEKLLAADGISVRAFHETEIEPTDRGIEQAARRTDGAGVDGYIAVGGGSSIDTAKMLSLLHSYPGVPVARYLNRPVGDGEPVPGPVRPLIAVPTTSGTGSECTAMVALEVSELRVKTGIADRRLTPAVAIVDPLNTVTMPAAVTAASGYDVLCHACESYTARPFDHRPPYPAPEDRPIYVGANPISDVWAEQALRLTGRYLRRAVLNPHDLRARAGMSQAALFAGLGFGNAGTHIPHACAYPIAGLARDYVPAGYPSGRAFVPHGQAVVATAPAAFAFTFAAAPERHIRAAELLAAGAGARLDGVDAAGPDLLPGMIRDLVRDTGGSTGIAAFGFGTDDISDLIDGAVRQQRLLSCCPRDVTATDLERIFAGSLAEEPR